MCFETFDAATSLSGESHKGLSVPRQSRESGPENRPSDKELEATGTQDLREEREQREVVFLFVFFLSSAGRMTNMFQSRMILSDSSGFAIA